MLSQEAFSFWCQQSGLSEQTQAVIQQVRSSDPARRVGGGEHNVSGRYPSRKMGFTIQFESHRVELAFVHEMEHDPDVFEFYDQPPSFMLDYEGKQGRRLLVKHTPDYFVICNQTAGWIECKTEEELLKLGEKSPNRYCRNDDGRWHCPPGESYAAQFGLSYRVRSSREVNWVFQRNIQFLEDYLRSNAPLVTSDARAAVVAHVAPTTGITLADLFCKLGDTATRDDVYALIATGGVYVNLGAVPIVEPEKLRVFQSKELAAAHERAVAPQCPPVLQRSSLVNLVGGSALTWDGRVWVVSNTGQTAISLLGQDGALVDLPHATFEELIKRGAITGITRAEKGETRLDAREQLAPMTPGGLEEANRRYKIIQPYLNGERVKERGAPARTIYRWLARYRTAETTLGTGYLGLLPHHHECGNRRRRVSEETQKLMAEFIDQQYETVKQKRKLEVYGSLARACESRGTIPPSYKTFTREIKRRPCYEQTLKRKGRRAAYPYQPCYLELELTTPRHGEFPFQIGHIDHTELDVELLCSVTGRNLGRPWLTILTDAFSRRFLAVFLTYDPPSYRSCMMVLRECVRRHGRLPQTIVVDGGREFGSLYFETLLARYECTKKTRPPGKARFGAVCERLFGTSVVDNRSAVMWSSQLCGPRSDSVSMAGFRL